MNMICSEASPHASGKALLEAEQGIETTTEPQKASMLETDFVRWACAAMTVEVSPFV